MLDRKKFLLTVTLAVAPALATAGHYEQAVRLLKGREPTQAVPLLKRAIRDERNVKASYLLGRLQLKGVGGLEASPRTAARHFYRAARKGHVRAQTALGVLYARGQGVPKSAAKARGWIGLAASRGDAKAEKLLARLGGRAPAPLDEVVLPLDEVDGEIKEFVRGLLSKEGMDQARQAAEGGSVLHQVMMGVAHEIGILLPVDHGEAARWYEMAAKRGNGEAARRLGTMVRRGDGREADPAGAARWYAVGAKKGDSLSMQYLAAMLARGEGVAPDPGKAIGLLDRAATKGQAYEKYLIGLRFAQGVGAPEDPARARRWLLEAAPGLGRQHRFRIGVLLYSGRGVEHDKAAAKVWIEKAAAAGEPDALVATDLLRRTPAPTELSAEGTDFAEAIRELPDALGRFFKRVNGLFAKASGQGEGGESGGLGAMMAQMTAALRHQMTPEVVATVSAKATAGVPEAQRLLGTLHMVGVGVDKDLRKARRLLQLAGDQGDPQALLLLGQMSMTGMGGDVDYEAAAGHWARAAETGFPMAQLQLAQAYLFGLGVDQDVEKGEAMLRELAAGPDVGVRFAIALLFEAGMGVPQDLDLARELLQSCADAGIPLATEQLKEMGAR